MLEAQFGENLLHKKIVLQVPRSNKIIIYGNTLCFGSFEENNFSACFSGSKPSFLLNNK